MWSLLLQELAVQWWKYTLNRKMNRKLWEYLTGTFNLAFLIVRDHLSPCFKFFTSFRPSLIIPVRNTDSLLNLLIPLLSQHLLHPILAFTVLFSGLILYWSLNSLRKVTMSHSSLYSSSTQNSTLYSAVSQKCSESPPVYWSLKKSWNKENFSSDKMSSLL